MVREFFRRPYGVGTALNIHMFHPQRLVHAARVLAADRRYFVARLDTIFYQLMHPDRPWLTRQANAFLMDYLKPDMVGFEWGSGKSTTWLAKRCAKLVSVEDDPAWFHHVQRKIRGMNVALFLVPASDGCDRYAGRIDDYPDGTFDFILVDGSCRDRCIERARSKVRRNGIIVVDNADLGYDISPLAGLTKTATDNGVWRTDIFINS